MTIVVPCFNEAARLDRAEFLRLAQARPDLRILFVDDGSTDGTALVLEAMRAIAPGQVQILRLARNSGKAEAVRQGLLAAVEGRAQLVGYADADLSTPVNEILRMIADMERRPVDALLGARVRLLGSRIERRLPRHLAGRLFATVASVFLRLPVYDTQCGAKLFRATPALAAAVATPFRSRWVFDVELLGRLLRGSEGVEPLRSERIRELPLAEWRDIAGSKLRLRSMLRAGLQLLAMLIADRLRPSRQPAIAADEPTPALLDAASSEAADGSSIPRHGGGAQ